MKNDIRRAFELLTKKERQKIAYFSCLQALTGALDLLGLLLVGLIASVSLEHQNSGKLTQRLFFIFNQIHLNFVTWTSLLGFLIVVTLILLLGKSISSIFLTRSLYLVLANSLGRIAKATFQDLLMSKYLWIKHVKSQEVGYALTDGLTYLVIGIVGSYLMGIVEISMLAFILLGLAWINPVMAAGAAIFFLLLAIFINSIVGRRVKNYGLAYTKSGTESRSTLTDAILLYREISLSETEDFFIERFTRTRAESAFAYGRLYWLQQVPKYVMELGIILGAVLLAGLSWLTSHSSQGITSLAVFLMASTRVVPSILRLQGVHLSLREFSGKSEKTFSILNDLKNSKLPYASVRKAKLFTELSPPTIHLIETSFSYGEFEIIRDIDLTIEAGSEITLMGPSGSGKSTICELAIGLLTPNSGSVTYDGLSISKWRSQAGSSIAYLPQDPYYFGGTIRENVTLGDSQNDNSDDSIWEALDFAQVGDHVRALPHGLETLLSDRGVQLSGGQRQRLGIARSLYRKPQVLVMDEGTSALDHETEFALVKMLSLLKGKSTVIKVAHRISSVTQDQKIAYIEGGLIKEIGTIGYLREKLPTFDLSISSNTQSDN